VFLALILAVSCAAHAGQDGGKWAVTFYAGQSNTADLLEIVRFKFERWEEYRIAGLAVARDLAGPDRYFMLELAGQIVKHLERASLFEFDSILSLRWRWFPWNEHLLTTIAYGEGLSYATGYPASEDKTQGIRSNFLNALLVEITLTLPRWPDWGLVLRDHHRSGVYGLINGVSGGSNYISLGLMKRF